MADDLLKPAEIEALLKAAGAGAPSAQPSAGSSEGSARSPVSGSSAESPASAKKSLAERLLEQAEQGLAAAVSPNLHPRAGIPADLGAAASFTFQPFESASDVAGGGLGLDALHDVELDLRIELGRTELLIEEVLQLKEGSVVPLNKLAGDPVDILVNGRLLARGEVLVLNDNFCVRIAEIVPPTL